MLKHTRRSRLVTGLALAGVLTATVTATAAAADSNAGSTGRVDRQATTAMVAKVTWKPFWHSEFGDSDVPKKWMPVASTGLDGWNTLDRVMVSEDQKSQAHYLKRNVDVRGGNLVVTTERHCVPDGANHKDFDLYRDRTATTAVCGASKKAVYSSGRLDMLDASRHQSGNFRLEFRASMPNRPAVGTRQALWMHNTASYCDKDAQVVTNLGEFDALEWYGDRPGRMTATTHMSCKGSGDDAWRTLRKQHADPMSNADSAFHVWSVEKIGNRVKYFMDGAQVDGKDVCGAGVFTLTAPATCEQVMGLPYYAIINGEVFKDGKNGTGHRSPLDGQPFPKQMMQVDWVRAYTS